MGAEFQPSLIACFLYLWTSRLEDARAVLMAGCARWQDRGAEHWLAWAQHPRVWLECWRGDLASATTAMHEGVERLLELETPIGRALALTNRAQVAAYAGRAGEARRDAEEALALFERAGWAHAAVWPLTTLGFLALSQRDHAAAAASVAPAAAIAAASGMPEPAAGGGLLYGDAAEALVALGRVRGGGDDRFVARTARRRARPHLGDRRRRALPRPPPRRPRRRPWRRASLGARARRARAPANADRTRAQPARPRSHPPPQPQAPGRQGGAAGGPRDLRGRRVSRSGPTRRRRRSPASACAHAPRTPSRQPRNASLDSPPRDSPTSRSRPPCSSAPRPSKRTLAAPTASSASTPEPNSAPAWHNSNDPLTNRRVPPHRPRAARRFRTARSGGAA